MSDGGAGDPMTVQRLRIDLAYDGGPFAGFARQPDQITVQGTLEGALQRLTGQTADLTCAGRTDRGVHALGQVVHLDVDAATGRAAGLLERIRDEPDRVRAQLDALVGDAITIWRIRPVAATFDARFSATAREYRYVLVDAPAIDPRRRHVVWHVAEPLGLRAMQEAAKELLGEHDFSSFCRKAEGKHTIRRLDEVSVSRRDDEIHVRMKGPAFCHQQVRSIVGCLHEVGRGRRSPEWLTEVLAARDRAGAARVAPPQGLTLEAVRYGRR